ncbi:MAG TPA: phosphotransferase [Ardenticatenaceae bacterium]|nr:phosphotransferase [Ardenticatenaceae bacterium]
MITSLEQVTPEWLTGVLRDVGVLGPGRVIAAEQRGNDAFNSTIGHFTLRYSDDAPRGAPRALMLKLNRDHDGASEVGFYTALLPQHERLSMLVRCYAGAYDPESGDSFLLLEDVSPTHGPPVRRTELLAGAAVPGEQELDSIVEALARFHASWWEHPELGSGVCAVRGWYGNEEQYRAHVDRRQREWRRFIASVGAWFPGDLAAEYERLLAALPSFWRRFLAARVTTRRNLTLTHGDCYLTQFLIPTVSDGPVYLIDFQDVSANFGPYDLVYLFATFWTPQQRQEGKRQERLLRRYHGVLQACGAGEYRWEQLLEDYKLMVALMLFDPIWNQTSGASQEYWWPKLRNLVGAYRDLGCAALLGET